MDRLEYKYLIPEDVLAPVRRQILPFVTPDRHMDPAGEYSIRSIYFDTSGLDYYHQKQSGIQHRRKLRLRGYGQQSKDALVFLEIKRKDNEAISKARAPFHFEDWEALFASGDLARYIHNAGDDPLVVGDAQSFFFHIHRYSLLPIVLVSYEREAYFARYNSRLRVTLDKNLRSASFPRLEELYSEKRQKKTLEGHFIMELKFYDGMPGWFKAILEKYGLERSSLSKYTLSLDEHHIPQRTSAFSVWSSSRSSIPGLRRGGHPKTAQQEC